MSLLEGVDFTIARVDSPTGGLGIYYGGYPSGFAEGDVETFEGQVLGRPLRWFAWRDENLHREGYLERDGGILHLFLEAESEEELERLATMIASLREGRSEARGGLPACGPRDPSLATGELPTLFEARWLALRRELALHVSASERKAWQRIVVRPDAEAVFRAIALAREATVAGRVYGLAGLVALGASDADDLTCRLRPEGSPAATRTLRPSVCPQRTTPALAAFDDPDAIYVEPHWGIRARGAALSEGPIDLRGGGITVALSEPLFDDAMHWMMERVAISRLARPSPSPMPSDPGEIRARWLEVAGDVCWMAATGVVRCVEHEVPRAFAPSDASMWAFADDDGCVLDAAGQRVCFTRSGYLERELAARCGAALPEVRISHHDDGPWARLVAGLGRVCGVRDSGALFCFDGLDLESSVPGDPKEVAWASDWLCVRGPDAHCRSQVGRRVPLASDEHVVSLFRGIRLCTLVEPGVARCRSVDDNGAIDEPLTFDLR